MKAFWFTAFWFTAFRLKAFGFLCAALVAFGIPATAADFKQPAPLEPVVAEASSEPAEVMAGIRVPEGWQIELFAAEPDVANVVAFDVDPQGRVYVCETFRQNRGVTDNRGHDEAWVLADLAAETVQDRIDYHKRLLGDAAVTYAQHDDRIRRIEDTDGDGRVDRSVVLASGFNHLEEGTGAGVLARGKDVYYTCIPKLWKLVDADDDGVADERVVLSDGYGVRVAFRGHDMHGLIIGPDGRLYFSIGDRGYNVTTRAGEVLADPQSGAVFRCELDGTGLEVFAGGMRNPQELAFNDVGDLFSVDNNSDSGDRARVIHILERGDTGWRMQYQYMPDRGPFNREKIWEPFHREQPAYIVPPIANFTDGPSGLAYYPGTGFGDQLKNRFLICDFRGGPANSGIRSFELTADGAFYALGEDSDPIWTVLATDVAFGPAGDLFVSDWVNGWDGLGKGRIYRISDPVEKAKPIVAEVQSLLSGDWSAKPADELADLIGHVDRRVRLEAQWQLAQRGLADPLLGIATDSAAQTITRLHAVWGADQIARTQPTQAAPILAALRPLIQDADSMVRAAAIKVAGERGDQDSQTAIAAKLADPSARVRYFAAVSLGKLGVSQATDAVVAMLAENDNADPALRHAGVMFLADAAGAERIAKLAGHPSESVRRAAVVALRRLRSAELATFLGDSSELVVLEAARAIHDVPVPVAMPALARLLDKSNTEKPWSDPNLIRRVLNANYRLGKPETAARLAEYATRVSTPAEMRIEALDQLRVWAKPDPRDRVINAFRELPERPGKDAADALAPQIDLLMSSQESVREKAIDVASALGIDKIVPLLIARVADADQRSSIRAAALSALSRLDAAEATKLASGVKSVPANELLTTSLRVLARHDAQGSLERFIEATQSRNQKVRQLGWDLLAKSDSPEALSTILAGVGAYLDGTLPSDVHLNVLEAARGKLDSSLQEELIEHDRNLAEADSLGPWLVSLNGGNAQAGKKIFFEKTELSCLRCHQVDRAGGKVGPDLTLIGKQKDRRYLLESICLPDAVIAKGYETAVLATDSGIIYSGIVLAETDDYVELVQSDGAQVTIDVEEVVGRRKGKSSMPEDLTKYMTPRELRDLVSYLASLQVDPRSDADVE